jgi:16S rRNA (uracil1498-N3)-methyltransferase
MSVPRFHIPPELWDPHALVLTGDEARHCTQVMRRTVGDEVIAFNGAGVTAQCRIVSASTGRVELACENLRATSAPSVQITLLQAIPKAGNMELIIEKAVELGVNTILPVLTERTVVKLDAKEAARKRDKWRRLALEACKQCGQDWLPSIHLPQPFSSVWDDLPAHDLRLIAALQDDSKPLKEILGSPRLSQRCSFGTALVAIGPEGDFTPAEYRLARDRSCLPISLGSIVLRVETAALFCLSVVSYELRQSRAPHGVK